MTAGGTSRESAPGVSALNGVRVLLVEDHTDMRDLLAFLLRKHGAEVFPAACVKEALDAFRAHNPDIVITDLSMPMESGLDLLRAVRECADPVGARVPVVVLTGHAAVEAELLAAGFQMCLTKPVDSKKLTECIARLCGRSDPG